MCSSHDFILAAAEFLLDLLEEVKKEPDDIGWEFFVPIYVNAKQIDPYDIRDVLLALWEKKCRL